MAALAPKLGLDAASVGVRVEQAETGRDAPGEGRPGEITLRVAPGSTPDIGLVAHELAHVAQHANRGGGGAVADTGASEAQAVSLAAAARANRPLWTPRASLPAAVAARSPSPTGGPGPVGWFATLLQTTEDQAKILVAQSARAANLAQASKLLSDMAMVLQSELFIADDPVGFGRSLMDQGPWKVQVRAVSRWLHTEPGDPAYFFTLAFARGLLDANAATHASLIPRTGPTCTKTPAHAWSVPSRPDLGIELCDMWFDSDKDACRTDVLIHETNHLLGMDHGHFHRAEQPTADALNDADTMAQFVNSMLGLSVDNCK